MNNFKYIFGFSLVLLLFSSCQEDQVDKNKDVVTIDEETKNDFDTYLEQIYVKPYNVEFIYKWDDKESNMNHILVPARLEKSIQMANIVKYLALDAYAAVAPSDFLKKYFPKNIMLVGSGAYQNNGTVILGTAESGVKITLYDINNLSNISGLTEAELEPVIEHLFRRYFRTIFHEFSHILHQTVDYSPAFEQISKTDYVGNEWNSAWKGKNSLAKGFISDYSSKERNEDFVELIAHYVTYTPEKWQKTIEDAGEEGGVKLNQKIEIVKTYMQDRWSINMDELRDEVLKRAKTLNKIDLNKSKI